ncbi:MAG: helix-turn-helix domain-containing protein [Candidatus Methanomethylophilaceae archaeon]|jgi:predicted transcriptional regulator|nr:helix-turn-helix domain-containing protein [Candidatus Methanomethylophilaceae archaeon]
MDIDDLLAMVENPTRRRILELLTSGPSYPLQLSKELGVSQQAVMKNLVLMERNGMVVSYRESSTMGPDRTVYIPNTAFTLVVDMHSGMFSVRLLPEPDDMGEREAPSCADETLERMSEIDEEIEELEQRRSALMSERDRLAGNLARMCEDETDDKRRARILQALGRTTGRAETPLRR